MDPKKTELYDTHVKHGGKMIDFAGYLMPVRYDGDILEHQRVRSGVGVFDVSHMGEFFVKGAGAESFLQKLTVNDVSKLAVGQAQYSAVCNENGGIIDDLIVYRFPDRYMVVVNASNRAKDLDWFKKWCPADVEVIDQSDEISLIAVQGPKAEAVLQDLTDVSLSDIKFYWFAEGEIGGCPAVISRTGYTGEPGFELYVENGVATRLWEAIFKAGRPFEIGPAGLGARDTLRLEMKFCLYGNDIDETTHPIEAGLGWITRTNKGDFIGRDSIMKAKEDGILRTLVGFEVEGRIPPRHGYEIASENGPVGHVTSGSYSPSLEKGIGMGYVKVERSGVGTPIVIKARNREIPAQVVKTPFYKREG